MGKCHRWRFYCIKNADANPFEGFHCGDLGDLSLLMLEVIHNKGEIMMNKHDTKVCLGGWFKMPDTWIKSNSRANNFAIPSGGNDHIWGPYRLAVLSRWFSFSQGGICDFSLQGIISQAAHEKSHQHPHPTPRILTIECQGLRLINIFSTISCHIQDNTLLDLPNRLIEVLPGFVCVPVLKLWTFDTFSHLLGFKQVEVCSWIFGWKEMILVKITCSRLAWKTSSQGYLHLRGINISQHPGANDGTANIFPKTWSDVIYAVYLQKNEAIISHIMYIYIELN